MKEDNTGRKIIFIGKKKELCSNDLFKLVAVDLIDLILNDNLGPTSELKLTKEEKNEYITNLYEIYKDQLYELRTKQKIQSKQMEITDGKDEGENSNKTSN